MNLIHCKCCTNNAYSTFSHTHSLNWHIVSDAWRIINRSNTCQPPIWSIAISCELLFRFFFIQFLWIIRFTSWMSADASQICKLDRCNNQMKKDSEKMGAKNRCEQLVFIVFVCVFFFSLRSSTTLNRFPIYKRIYNSETKSKRD